MKDVRAEQNEGPRVLHFYSTYFPDTFGGAELAINQICESTRPHGFVSSVLALSQNPIPKEISIGNHKVIRCKTAFEIASTRFSFSAVSELRRQAKSHDLIHFHFPWPFADLCLLLSGIETPYVITYHSDIVKQRFLLGLYAPLMKRFLSGAKTIVATSPQYASSSLVLRQYSETTEVIPLALDGGDRPSILDNDLAYWRGKLPKRFFLFLGVLRYYKGVHLLIEAARDSELGIVIAGAGPEEAALKLLAKDCPNIFFVGRVTEEQKVALLSLSFGFVFPSHLRSEAFGMSLLEAAAYGLPLITFEIGTGTSLVNQNAVTGIVIDLQGREQEAPRALRLAMESLAANPVLAAQYGAAARARLGSHFNPEQMGSRYADLYHRAITSA
jgi:O-antigen biosynthesis rhamnosyltransferase